VTHVKTIRFLCREITVKSAQHLMIRNKICYFSNWKQYDKLSISDRLHCMISSRGRPNIVFFLFFGARKRIFLFFGRKRHPHFRFFSFFGTKMAVKKSQYFGWANARQVELLSRLQSHTAAVYIATRSAWVLWGSKHWAESADSVCCLCGCSRLV